MSSIFTKVVFLFQIICKWSLLLLAFIELFVKQLKLMNLDVRSLLNCVPSILKTSSRALRAKNVLRCLRALRACVLMCLRAYVLTYQHALCAYVLTCQRALHAYVLTCQCVLVLTWSRANVICVLTCSYVNVPSLITLIHI